MRILPLAAVLLVAAALPVRAEGPPPYKAEDCSKFEVQMELNQCAGDNYALADGALNKVYKQVMASQPDEASRRRLKVSERAWISYRDKQCNDQAGPEADGGSIWPMEMSNCLEDMTVKRIHELKTEGGCTGSASLCYHH